MVSWPGFVVLFDCIAIHLVAVNFPRILRHASISVVETPGFESCFCCSGPKFLKVSGWSCLD